MKKLILVAVTLVLLSCNQSTQTTESSHQQTKEADSNNLEKTITGLWRGVLHSPGGELPFGIELSEDAETLTAKIINGSERVDTSSVEYNPPSIVISFSWFDAKIQAELNADGTEMKGFWRKTDSGKQQSSQLDFTATRGYAFRFESKQDSDQQSRVEGQWPAVFYDEDGDSLALGEFKQKGSIVTGTFLTPTGDYRYLAGDVSGNRLKLSAFDGAHAFLFDAQIEGQQLTHGNFWSAEAYHATWKAKKSEDTADYLPSSWEMNKVTTEDQSVSFAFADNSGKIVQLSDKRFENKAVLINLFGTWCPNCNDEAPVLAKFYDQYHSQGLEVVGLAFEYTEDPQRDWQQIEIFKQRHAIHYPLLLAGGNDKDNATKILGFLDQVKSYPTTVFLNKEHKVVKINTGFSGPGTGEHYLKLVAELEQEIKDLL